MKKKSYKMKLENKKKGKKNVKRTIPVKNSRYNKLLTSYK